MDNAKQIAEKIVKVDDAYNSTIEHYWDGIEAAKLARAYLTLLACKSGIRNEYHGDDDLLDDDSEVFVNESFLIAANAKIAALTAALNSAGECGHGALAAKILKLEAENATLTANFKELKIYYDDLYVRADGDRITKLELDNDDLNFKLEDAKAALNRIGILGMSSHAYTSEFTERVRAIVNEALNSK